jgi:integrase
MKHLLQAFGELKLSSIQAKLIERYKRRRREEVSAASVNRELVLFKHMFHKAVDWQYMNMNPAQTVKLLKEPQGRLRYLLPEEREFLLQECSGMLRAIVITALETGMRKSELLNLTWKDVDLIRRTITVTRTKNNEIRVLPISDTLQPILERLYRERRGLYVFAKEDGSSYGNWRGSFESACDRAGIEDLRFHDLRHTFASYLVMAGVDIRTVQELMGHKDIKMTMRYSHLSKAHLLEAVNKIGTKLAHFGFDTLENLTSDVETNRRRSSVGRAAES